MSSPQSPQSPQRLSGQRPRPSGPRHRLSGQQRRRSEPRRRLSGRMRPLNEQPFWPSGFGLWESSRRRYSRGSSTTSARSATIWGKSGPAALVAR